MHLVNRARRGRLFSATALAAALSAIGGAAFAQQDGAVPTSPPDAQSAPVDPRDAKIQQLQEEIQDLAAQVQDLKGAQANTMKAVQTQQTQPQIGLANARPQITSSDGNFKFAIRSVVQFDAAHTFVSPQTSSDEISSGTNFRRARLGIDATAYHDWNFSIWGEFGGSGSEAAGLNQAYVEYAGFKPFPFADPLHIRAGAWATPAGLEDATANTEELFLERADVEEMIRGLDAGDGREGAGVFATGKHWYFSGVLTGKVAGSAPASVVYDQQEGFLTRLAINPLHGADYDVHIGGSIQGVIKPATGPVLPNTITLAQQPELRVDSNATKLVSTGAINASGMTDFGAEAGASFRNFYVAGEWYKLDVDRTGLGTAPALTASPFNPSFSGWYVQGAWTLTGERHVWSPSNGGFRGIYQPKANFNPAAGDWGAWEIAARYSVLNLNDDAGAAGASAPTGGIRGGEQKITTLGVNFYPNPVIRFLLDYQIGNVDRLSSTGSWAGEHLHAVSFRSQFAF